MTVNMNSWVWLVFGNIVIAFALISIVVSPTLIPSQRSSQAKPDLVVNSTGKKTEEYFAICMIVKSEANLAEWVEYHNRIGCDKFYIFDNNSSFPLLPSVEKYIKMGIVDFKKIDETHPSFNLTGYPGGTLQLKIFNKCIREYRTKHSFIGFIDSDEFIVLPQNEAPTNKQNSVSDSTQTPLLTIPAVLQKYENYGGLALNWMMFGSSGHDRRPPGGVIENYWKCTPNMHIKTIVNTKYVIRDGGTPHNFATHHLKPVVDTNFERVPLTYNPPDGKSLPNATLFSEMYINHYHLKSFQDFEEKMKRGRFNRGKFSIEYFKAQDRLASHNCSVLRMPPPREAAVQRLRSRQ